MKPIKQICKRIHTVVEYVIYYMVISFGVILMFALFYYFLHIKNPIDYSMKVFLGVAGDFIEEVSFCSILETLISNLFNVIVVSSVLIKFLNTLNPIIISDYVTYNNKSKKYKFCYWIMLPEGRFLYEINIRIFLTTREAHLDGVNALRVVWQSEDENVINLKLARGVRYAQLSKKESKKLYKLIKKEKETGEILKRKYELNFVLSGNDAAGSKYYAWKRYKLDEIWYGYQFVPLQQHEYTSDMFFKGNEDEMNHGDGVINCAKELFRYQHFGKLFALKNSEGHNGKVKKNIILTKNQIVKGQYKGLRQKLLDFCSWTIMLFLDCFHWKAWWRSRP